MDSKNENDDMSASDDETSLDLESEAGETYFPPPARRSMRLNGYAARNTSECESPAPSPLNPPFAPVNDWPFPGPRPHGDGTVECTHVSWCDCPMHASHAAGNRYPHLSSWALDHTDFPESRDRYQFNPSASQEGVNDEKTHKRLENAQRWSEWVAVALPKIGFGELDSLVVTARALVDEINCAFNPTHITPQAQDQRPVIEQVGQAIRQWRQDLDYARLGHNFAKIVDERTDLLLLFQSFLPVKLRKVIAVQFKVKVEQDGEELTLADKLEKDRLTLGDGSDGIKKEEHADV